MDVNKLVGKLQKINDRNAAIDVEFEKHKSVQNKLIEKGRRVKELENELKELENAIKMLSEEVIKLKAEEALFKDIEKSSTDDLRKSIKNAEVNNNAYREQESNNEKLKTIGKEVEELSKKSLTLTKSMDDRNEKKQKMLSKCVMPIEGLTVENKIIRYNGVNINDCSTAERIRISFGIAVSLNPMLKVVFIREGGLLDNKNKKLIVELAREKGYTIWLELLESTNKDKGVMRVEIEDGSVI